MKRSIIQFVHCIERYIPFLEIFLAHYTLYIRQSIRLEEQPLFNKWEAFYNTATGYFEPYSQGKAVAIVFVIASMIIITIPSYVIKSNKRAMYFMVIKSAALLFLIYHFYNTVYATFYVQWQVIAESFTTISKTLSMEYSAIMEALFWIVFFAGGLILFRFPKKDKEEQ